MSDTPPRLDVAKMDAVRSRQIAANVLSLLGVYIKKLEEHQAYLDEHSDSPITIKYRTVQVQSRVLENVIHDLTDVLL